MDTRDAGPTVPTDAGRVRGEVDDGIAVFRGIPFAAAPHGPLRFALPAAPRPWTGVRETTAFSAAPPQLPPVPGLPPVWRPEDGPDYLTVNYRIGFEGFGPVCTPPSRRLRPPTGWPPRQGCRPLWTGSQGWRRRRSCGSRTFRWRAAPARRSPPVVDGDLVTGPPWTATLPPEVDLICGFMHEEYRFFTGGPGGSDVPPAGLLAHLGLPPGALAAYRAAEPEATDRELVTAIMSDFLFRMPTTWLARAHARAGGRTWL